MTELVTIPNIQLIATGSWLGNTNKRGGGEVTFTEEDLRNIMASQDAPDVKEPRMILGHTGMSEGPGMSAVSDEGFFGEQPAIGKFTNLALSPDGQEITGDLVGVPKWLADILPTAYPSRSVEVYWDVPSGIPGAPSHACIMPRVALLGINLPAVATLEDLRVLFSDEGPEIELDLAKASKRVAASREDKMPDRVAASVQFEDVRRDFYSNFATEASGRYWWWINAVYVDPQVLIVDDDEESLWSVPYTVKGEEVEFGEPVKIKVQYVEEESGKVAAQQAELNGRKYAKAESRPLDRKKETAKMGLDIPALRTRAGLTVEQLPDDATEEQINAALAAPVDEPEAPAASAAAEEDDKPEPEQRPAESAAASVVTVDRAAFDQQQAEVKRLKDDLDKRTNAERTQTVVDAIKAGKIPPSRKEHYVGLMQRDPEGTAEFLAKMESVIPADQREVGADADPTSDDAMAATDYDLSWLSESERSKVEAARSGSGSDKPRIVMEA